MTSGGKNTRGDSLSMIYKRIYTDMVNAPEISPRGLRTKELIAPTIRIMKPWNRIAYHPDRKFNLEFAIVESLMLFDESNDAKYLAHVNKRILDYSDDGETMYGSYGYRIAQYIPEILRALVSDRDSRQIVFPILRIEDIVKETKDTPCTISLQLLLRDDKLHMIVNMRSNDIMWGLPYDMFSFSTFQEVIANTLGVHVGEYIHRPGSLHLYEHHYDLFEHVAQNFKNVHYRTPFQLDAWYKMKDEYKEKVVEQGSDFEMFHRFRNFINVERRRQTKTT